MTSKTKKLDLDHDVTINDVTYAKGKGVEVDSKSADEVQRINDEANKAGEQATTHHGAVPAPAYPEEATAQTPTRPLGAPELRQAVSSDPAVEDGEVVTVDDKGNETPADLESAKEEFEASKTEATEKAEPTQEGPSAADVEAENKTQTTSGEAKK